MVASVSLGGAIRPLILGRHIRPAVVSATTASQQAGAANMVLLELATDAFYGDCPAYTELDLSPAYLTGTGSIVQDEPPRFICSSRRLTEL